MVRSVFLVSFLLLSAVLMANNVKITQEVSVDKQTVTTVADLKFQLSWENSWRDDFNWDAVYVFLKYKKKSDADWKHASLMNSGHVLSDGFDYWMASHTYTANVCRGAFLFRGRSGKGSATVDAVLKWNIANDGLVQNDFQEGIVEMSLMCIEMVYVPKGAFYLGDGVSKNTFKTNYRPILPEWDVIKNDGTQKYTATNTLDGYPAERAANRVNEGRGSGHYANSWRSNAGAAIWQVEFPTAKRIRFFGISAVEGQPSYRPAAWVFEGSKNGVDNWKELSNVKEASGWTMGPDSYPVVNALPVNKDAVDDYRFYRVRITTAGNGVMMNNIAMTEIDLDTVNNNGYIVDGQTVYMNAERGLCSADGDTWNATLAATYPTGFEGFYAMKYEISQEQYVRFLNKLNATQQKTRTVGDALDQFIVGDYVYGQNRQRASFRNGIIVGTRVDGGVIFANNLNKDNGYSQEDDGQTLACNYLSVADMLAYADWSGLRPLSEMEYEKMARRPYPYSPKLKDWAGGTVQAQKLPISESFSGIKGSPSERLANANVNAGAKVSGPVRVGSFGKNANNPTEAGASYWGLMDLSGNLAEIYYNVNTYGRGFADHYYGYCHGDGALDASGNNNVSTGYWPTAYPAAFCLRGGSFLSEKVGESEGEIAISDRTKARVYSTLNLKDSTATFRLGHSCTYLTGQPGVKTYTSYIQLQNGKSSTTASQFDSVCVNTPYTIKGSVMLDATTSQPVDIPGRTNYIWYISENGERTWNIIPGENNRDLVYSNWRDESNTVREVRIKRRVVTPVGMHETNPVWIRVVNDYYTINRLKDTIKQSNQSLGFYAKTALPSTYTWRWKSAPAGTPAIQTDKTTTASYYFPKRENYKNTPDSKDFANQNHVLQCEIMVSGKCRRNIELKVFIEERLSVGIASNDVTMGGTDRKRECGVMMQDSRDGKVYGTVKIGNQCWMAENLRFEMPGSIVYQTGDPDGSKFGCMYYYSTNVINNGCPAGWRLPANADYNQLRSFLGTTTAGIKMRAGNNWNVSEPNMGTNVSGFGAVGSGYYNNGTSLYEYTYFVTSDNSYYGLYRNAATFDGPSNHWSSSGTYYMSIRCIKR